MKLPQGAARGHAAMLGFSALVAGSFSLGGMAANEIDPVALNAVRFVIAGLALTAFAFASGGIPKGTFAAPWRYIFLSALLTSYFVLMFAGLKTAPPVSAAAVFTLTPIMAAGFGWLILRQVTTPRMALALAIGALGALWVIFRADLSALMAFEIGQGEVIYFIGCAAHALYIPVMRYLSRGEPAVAFTIGILGAGSMVLFIYGWRPISQTDWLNLPAIVWITIFYTALAATATTFVLLRIGTMRLRAAKVMAYTYLTPSWVILWEIALGHGVPSALTLGGVGLTAIALLLLLKGDD